MNSYTNIAEKALIFIVIIFCIGFLGRDFFTLDGNSFKFHDMTQYARIFEYSQGLKRLNIPPLYGKDMNHSLGYPMFVFYAPFAYLFGSILHIVTFVPVIEAVSITFFAFWIIGAFGIFALIKAKGEGTFAGFVGGFLYLTSPWWASEIFVRGNMATSSFLALAPWSLWGLYNYKKHPAFSAIFISIVTLSHNALSLLFIPVLLLYSLLLKKSDRQNRMIFTFFSILTSSWFWIPALLQIDQTYAKEVAIMIKYSDHFLCINQIWTSGFWGYGASLPGCNDGMSFMLGKIQIILFLLGIILAVFKSSKKTIVFFETLVVLASVFMTLPDSKLFWQVLPFLSVIQFPWRLLAISLPFVVIGGSYFFHFLPNLLHKQLSHNKVDLRIGFPLSIINKEFTLTSICVAIILCLTLGSGKFFEAQRMSKKEITNLYISKKYISISMAYEAPEYLPKGVNRDFWLVFRDKEIDSASQKSLAIQMAKFSPNGYYAILGLGISIFSSLLLWKIRTRKTQ